MITALLEKVFRRKYTLGAMSFGRWRMTALQLILIGAGAPKNLRLSEGMRKLCTEELKNVLTAVMCTYIAV